MNNFDLVFFHDLPRRLNPFTPATWDHVGIVLKDPTWLHINLKGTYIWEISDMKSTLIPASDRINSYSGRIYIRHSIVSNKALKGDVLFDTFNRLHGTTKTTLTAFWEIKNDETINWSALLVGYVLIRLKLLNYHGVNKIPLTPIDFLPKERVNKFVLPGISYSNKLIKLR